MSDAAATSASKPAFLSPSPQTLARAHVDIEFDSGINTSNAWTVSLASDPRGSLNPIDAGLGLAPIADSDADDANGRSLSDDELDGDPGREEEYGPGRPARALYAFEGKPEFRELVCVNAGDELEVLREDVGDGWSLARVVKCRPSEHGRDAQAHEGEVGLLPQTYYTFTSDFARLPGFALPTSSHFRKREASGSSITPRGSPTLPPLVPQSTGEWFPSFRRSLLGGRSLNRFSSFVTSGAEAWVLQGGEDAAADPPPAGAPGHARDRSENASEDDGGRRAGGEAERHFVEAGPAWRSKLPAFRVLVHSPSKRSSGLTGPFTVYTLTSIFDAPVRAHFRSASHPDAEVEETEQEEAGEEEDEPTSITVQRRFSHFVVLHTALSRRLPGIALPPLPEKQYAGRFNDAFVEARRGDLERYINRIVRHPVARYAEVLTFFLGCESDSEWKKQLPYYLGLPPKGPAFYAHVYHPAFNLDADDAQEAIERFTSHTRAVGNGVQGLRGIFGKVREARVEMSKAERLLSYSLLSLITCKPLASASPSVGDDPEEEDGANARSSGHVNSDGAWCWREDCEDCLRLSKAMQRTAETLQHVADIYDSHARKTQLATHEALKNVAHPATIYAPVIDTHKATLARYQDAVRQGQEDEEMAARCETVLNTTMAEMDTYHTQKVEDFEALAKEHLDGEIALYEQILTRLRAARRTFDPPQYEALSRSPRQPSMYERELETPRLTAAPLDQPCPHVFDSAPIRPVSVAIQEGVGMLLGNPTSRGSVFGKLW
ncbi:hypothetical protein WOLCODRAFT_125460 [Wolfiporia cocos MD-104 SS10]|uniref:PX-domain-containing protein n=1 Tax=Wolfiporia cocos (strain MD-104) TaxID=742152 RepID=A0A2H3J5S8_WOLCO|nr:hypothetical protein WOLCODRAFT_125460 [Wolfiporia cocos MD-104 SS10]